MTLMLTQDAIAWAGGTQQALADRLGITQPAVALWGDRVPDFRQLQLFYLSGGKLNPDPGILNPQIESV